MVENQVMNKDTPLEKIFRLTQPQKQALGKLKLKTAEDLLRYFPLRYGALSKVKSIDALVGREEATIFGRITKLETKKGFKSKVAYSEAKVDDGTSTIKVIWFHQPYIAKMFLDNSLVRIEGKVSEKRDGSLYLSNPKIEKVDSVPEGVEDSLFGTGGEDHALSPIYGESRGITSNWIYHAVQKVIKAGVAETLQDPIPSFLLDKYHLPNLRTALFWIHAPKEKDMAEASRKRFAFEEIFFIQLDRQREKMLADKEKSFLINKNEEEMGEFTRTFPFPLTGAQNRAVDTMLSDFRRGHPMSRLLEGDVGSGKTAVAASLAYAAVTTTPPKREYGNLQVAYMAPTEILAEQHFESFIELFSKFKIPVGLITGSGAKKFPSKVARSTSSGQATTWTKISKPQLIKWVENGEIPILIGTHALIQKSVKFKNLALIIIDEQHRFGVKQRMQLRRKHDIAPHLLSMTATPIPRTLALTIFGDLDLSVLDELPPGRKPVETKIVPEQERKQAYEKIREELKAGRQAYVICPRIDEADPTNESAVYARSVAEESKYLAKEVFQEYKIGSLTGKMSPKEKDEVMRSFKAGKIDILVATSVVEVGVNVPNATIILIENAERFGLAQLHQLRGRVLRSSHKPYCFVSIGSNSVKTLTRLKAFCKSSNGFELAESDLEQRGAGDLAGAKQWGISDLAMEALRNIKMVEFARSEARELLEKDFNLSKFPLLASRLTHKQQSLHLE